MNVTKSMVVMGAGSTKVVPLKVRVEAKGTEALIIITGHISEWSKASSGAILKDIKMAKDAGATKAKIYVNTQGGNVFEANEILNLIEDNFDNITVQCGALCASAGTIFPAKYKATGKPNSQFMIHKPSMYVGGNKSEIESSLKLLKNLTAEYKAMYAKKFGKTEEEIEALWEKGDYWMSAKEALKMGLIDEIEGGDEKIDAETRLQLVACGAPNIPDLPTSGQEQPQNQNQNQIPRMELSVLAVQLGLPSTATQEQVDAKLKELQGKAAKADALQKAADDKEKAEKAGKIKALLDQAEKDKKIDPTMRSNYEAIGENNLEQLEAILKTSNTIEPVSAQLNGGGKGSSNPTGEDRGKWTYEDYQQKAPEALIEMNEKEPEKFEALFKAHYKED